MRCAAHTARGVGAGAPSAEAAAPAVLPATGLLGHSRSQGNGCLPSLSVSQPHTPLPLSARCTVLCLEQPPSRNSAYA